MSVFGLHYCQANPVRAKQTGAGWARIVVYHPGDYKAIKATIAKFSNAGFDLVVTLRTKIADDKRRSGPPEDPAEWVGHVQQLAKDNPQVKHWQVQNEMWQWTGKPAEYISHLTDTGYAIQQVIPDAKIIAIGMTGGIPGTGTVAKKGLDALIASKQFDIFDLHSYSDDPREPADVAEWVFETMGYYGYRKPIFALETAGPFDFYSEASQAQDVPKRFLHGLHAQISVMFWSSLFPVTAWDDRYQRLSLIDGAGAERPAFESYRTTAGQLHDLATIEPLPGLSNKNVIAYSLRMHDGSPLVAAWTKSGQESLKFKPDDGENVVTVTTPTRRNQTSSIKTIPVGRDGTALVRVGSSVTFIHL